MNIYVCVRRSALKRLIKLPEKETRNTLILCNKNLIYGDIKTFFGLLNHKWPLCVIEFNLTVAIFFDKHKHE